MIEVSHLTKKYGSRLAVDDISFTVEDGVIYGLLGPNGAGKSTIMNILTGYLAATEGQVTVAGHPLPDDGPLHPRPAADGSRHLCLQDRLFAHHVPAIAQRPGGGVAIHAAILPQRNRIAERDRTAGSGGYAAHLRIQPPGILAHAAPQAYRQITIHGNLLEHHRLL